MTDTKPDSYGVAEAARVIGVSDRRVRQLVAEGVLTATSAPGEPLRVSQESTIKERQRRQDLDKPRAEIKKPAPGSVPISEVLKLAESIADRVMARALESADQERQRLEAQALRIEQDLRDELAKTRAELEIKTQELNELNTRKRWRRK
jgi:excisionase family DNA binding protein